MKKNDGKKILKKNIGKKFGKKNFEKKYFKTKIYKNINKCDTIFDLLAPLDRNREKHEVIAFTGNYESYYSRGNNEKVCAYTLGIGSK